MQISINTSNGFSYTAELVKSSYSTDAASAGSASTVSSSTNDSNLDTIRAFQQILEEKAKELGKDISTASDTDSVTGTVYPVYNSAASNVSAASAASNVSATSAVSDVDYNNGESITCPDELEPILKKASEKYGVDEKLLIAIAYHESRFKSDVTSSSGAMGIMQLMPATAKGLGVENAYDPEQNIMGAAKLVSSLMDEFDNNVDLAMAAYSNGSSTVKKYGGVPPIEQAQEFVSYINNVYPDKISL